MSDLDKRLAANREKFSRVQQWEPNRLIIDTHTEQLDYLTDSVRGFFKARMRAYGHAMSSAKIANRAIEKMMRV